MADWWLASVLSGSRPWTSLAVPTSSLRVRSIDRRRAYVDSTYQKWNIVWIGQKWGWFRNRVDRVEGWFCFWVVERWNFVVQDIAWNRNFAYVYVGWLLVDWLQIERERIVFCWLYFFVWKCYQQSIYEIYTLLWTIIEILLVQFKRRCGTLDWF